MAISAPATPSERPGLVTAIAVMTLVNGILNILWSGILALVLLATLFGILCTPLAIYPLVLGILEIIYSARLLSSRPPAVKPARYLAIMQICGIVLGNIISLVVGILSLVFYNDPAVKSYFGESISTPPQPSPPAPLPS